MLYGFLPFIFVVLGSLLFFYVTLSFLFSKRKRGNVVSDKGKAGNERMDFGFESIQKSMLTHNDSTVATMTYGVGITYCFYLEEKE